MENIKFYLIKGGRILQNMILKDIISEKAIKDELFLLITNVKSLMLSWRITRTPYLLSIILVYFSYIAMPGLIFNSLPEYEESVVPLIGYANLGISLVIFSLLAIRRVLDVNQKWISGFVIVAGIYTLYTNYLNYLPPILEVTYTEDSLITNMSVNLNILVVGLLILSLFPSDEYNNDYGLSNCIEKVGSSFIRIDYGGFEQFLDEFSLYKILPILKKILSLELFNWKGRISRGELIYYYIVYQFMVLLLVILIYSIGTILPTIFLKNIFLSSIVAIFVIWCFIYLLKVLIQRLHDSYSSAFWLFGVFIPYVNVYVLYLILFKGSWQYIDASIIGDNISH
ncbi:DUF805 domain-containing protein [Veillonella sp.]|uniref:DUF805 domain-containing protein n=1 Tax=Veillonella sp. TaxID=1926307 RepID=UPI002914A58B|nr:DUF805 domain-containing protein [Veillonella sp.]MDU5494314.1 DUF805 domain-containing protein [Veillonella sp.]